MQAGNQSFEKRTSALPGWLPTVVVPLLTLVLVGACVHANHRFFYDDSYITLRYARHLLAGMGPIWNLQGPRVEGFTSPLHLLLIAATSAMGVSLTSAARIVNVASHAVLVVFVYRYLRRHVGNFGALLGVMLMAASWIFIIWDLGGLDEILYACLCTIGALTGLQFLDAAEPNRDRALLAGMAWLAVATLARPEGGLLLGGLWLLAAIGPAPKRYSRIGILVLSILIAALILMPLVVFRWSFFHQIAPNTLYAKMGGISPFELLTLGARYLRDFLLTPPFLGLLAALAAVFSVKRRRFTAVDAGLWFFIALIALFLLACGGDHMLAYRFCLPMYSLLAVVFVRHLSRLGVLSQLDLMPALVGLLFTVLAVQARVEVLNPRYPDAAAHVGRVVGEYVRDHWQPGSVVALNTAGATPFVADSMQYIDMLGLNDLEIARRKNVPRQGRWIRRVGHLKGDGASVLARHPNYIILGPADGTTAELRERAFFIGDDEIANNPLFQQAYKPCVVSLPENVTFTFYQLVSAGRPCPGEQTQTR